MLHGRHNLQSTFRRYIRRYTPRNKRYVPVRISMRFGVVKIPNSNWHNIYLLGNFNPKPYVAIYNLPKTPYCPLSIPSNCLPNSTNVSSFPLNSSPNTLCALSLLQAYWPSGNLSPPARPSASSRPTPGSQPATCRRFPARRSAPRR